MKLDVTPAQLKAIKDMADYFSSAIGGVDEESAIEFDRYVKRVDSMLLRNNLPARDYK